MFPERLVVEDSFTADQRGVRFLARIPWYRALPFACFDFAVTLNGEPVNAAQISVRVGDHDVPLEALGELTEDYWFTTDPLLVMCADVEVPGENAEVDLAIGMRVPYIIAGPEAVRIEERRHVVVPVREGAK